jgi:hypothetical protein
MGLRGSAEVLRTAASRWGVALSMAMKVDGEREGGSLPAFPCAYPFQAKRDGEKQIGSTD